MLGNVTKYFVECTNFYRIMIWYSFRMFSIHFCFDPDMASALPHHTVTKYRKYLYQFVASYVPGDFQIKKITKKILRLL